jgi:hypothetical protein
MATFPTLFAEPARVFRVPGALPLAFAVGSARVADAGAALQTMLDPAFDPAREVILPHGPALASGPSFSGTVAVVAASPDRVVLEARLQRPGYVVLVDTYEPGWKATLDGAPVPVLRANMAFRAVQAPAGEHRIEYVYRPGSVIAGVAISMLSALAALAGGLVRRRTAEQPAAGTHAA